METVRQRTAQPGPVIRVIKGHAGAEELAALTAALLLRAGTRAESPGRPQLARGGGPAHGAEDSGRGVSPRVR